MKSSQVIRRAAERLDGSSDPQGGYSCLAIGWLCNYWLDDGEETYAYEDCRRARRRYEDLICPVEFGKIVPEDFMYDDPWLGKVNGNTRRSNDEIKQHRVIAMLMVADALEAEGL